MMSTQLTDRDQIVEVCIRVGWYADHRAWERYDEVFTDPVRLDYTSLAGGQPAELSRQAIVDSLRATLGGLDATQHLQGNHLVDIVGDHATCTACFQATHILPNAHGSPRWTLGGDYRFELTRTADGWRINSMTMTAVWADGNQQIMTIAATRP